MEEDQKKKESELSSAISKTYAARSYETRLKTSEKAKTLLNKWIERAKSRVKDAVKCMDTSKAKISKATADHEAMLQRVKNAEAKRDEAGRETVNAATKRQKASEQVMSAKNQMGRAEITLKSAKAATASAKEELSEARTATEENPSDTAVATLKVAMVKFKTEKDTFEKAKKALEEEKAGLAASEEAYESGSAAVRTAQASSDNNSENLKVVKYRVRTRKIAIMKAKAGLGYCTSQKKRAEEDLKKSLGKMQTLLLKIAEYEKDEKKAQEVAAKAAEKAKLNENESKTKKATREAMTKKDKELMEKAAATNMRNERKFKMALESRKKEGLTKASETKRKHEKAQKQAELADKAAEIRTKQEQKQKAKEKTDKAERASKAHIVAWKSRYAAAQGDAKQWPTMCPNTTTAATVVQIAPPVNGLCLDVINELLSEDGASGHYAPDMPAPQKRASQEKRIEAFQEVKHIDDAPGCVGKATFQEIFKSCPFPLSTKYCHQPRPCVRALQVLLYRWYPAGKITGRFCKETQVQTMMFQRRTISDPGPGGVSLFPSGIVNELDFITLLRRQGVANSMEAPKTPGQAN